MVKPKQSIVWHFFHESEKDGKYLISCKLCEYTCSVADRSKANTTNYLKHIKSRHPREYEDEMEQREERQKASAIRSERDTLNSFINIRPGTSQSTGRPSSAPETGSGYQPGTSNTQQTLQKCLDSKTPLRPNSDEALRYNKAVCEMIAVDNQPISVVEDLGFKRLVKEFKPRYTLPSRKYFMETAMPAVQTKIMSKITNHIEESEALSFTTDLWTSSNNESFISLTCHGFTASFENFVLVLKVSPFPESHTSNNIRNVIEEVLREYKIPDWKVHMIVRDNGANVKKALEDSNYNHLSCFLHTLQLVLNDSIFCQRLINDLIAKCRNIVTHFNHSATAQAKLKDIQTQQNLPVHKLIQDVSTRWNSTFKMLDRLYEQRQPIALYSMEHTTLPAIDGNQWALISKLCQVLKIFDVVTTKLSGRNISAGEILPQVRYIKGFIKHAKTSGNFNGIGTILNSLEESTNFRFAQYSDNDNCVLATVLDPRFKLKMFPRTANLDERNLGSSEVIYSILHRKTTDILNLKKTEQEILTSDSSEDEVFTGFSDGDGDKKNTEDNSTEFNFESYLSSCVNDEHLDESCAEPPNKIRRCSSSSRSNVNTSPLQLEFQAYLNEPLVSYNVDPISWWRINKDRFPKLTEWVKRYLSSPPSSVESERLFSIGGNIITPKRNRLTAQHGEMLMLLNFNLRAFNFDY